jgi:hypothetical protein
MVPTQTKKKPTTMPTIKPNPGPFPSWLATLARPSEEEDTCDMRRRIHVI